MSDFGLRLGFALIICEGVGHGSPFFGCCSSDGGTRSCAPGLVGVVVPEYGDLQKLSSLWSRLPSIDRLSLLGLGQGRVCVISLRIRIYLHDIFVIGPVTTNFRAIRTKKIARGPSRRIADGEVRGKLKVVCLGVFLGLRICEYRVIRQGMKH